MCCLQVCVELISRYMMSYVVASQSFNLCVCGLCHFRMDYRIHTHHIKRLLHVLEFYILQSFQSYAKLHGGGNSSSCPSTPPPLRIWLTQSVAQPVKVAFNVEDCDCAPECWGLPLCTRMLRTATVHQNVHQNVEDCHCAPECWGLPLCTRMLRTATVHYLFAVEWDVLTDIIESLTA